MKNFLCPANIYGLILPSPVKIKENMAKQIRKSIDCRLVPNEIECTLKISGSEKEVLKAAIRHAIEEHGHQDTPDLKRQLKVLLQIEKPKKNLKNKGE